MIEQRRRSLHTKYGFRLGWLPRVHILVFGLHSPVVLPLLGTSTAPTAMTSVIREDDGDMENVHRLTRQKGAHGGHRLRFVIELPVVI